jgi:hypothetical protein
VATDEPLTAFDDGTLQIDFVQQEVTIDRESVNLKPPDLTAHRSIELGHVRSRGPIGSLGPYIGCAIPGTAAVPTST